MSTESPPRMWQIVRISEDRWAPLGRRLTIAGDPTQNALGRILVKANKYWRDNGANPVWAKNPNGIGIVSPIADLSENLARIRKAGQMQGYRMKTGLIIPGDSDTAIVPILAADKIAVPTEATETVEKVSMRLTVGEWSLIQSALDNYADRINNAPLAQVMRELAIRVRGKAGS